MKKLLFIPFFLIISYFSNAQFKVYDNGNIGIGISNTVAGNKVKIDGSWGRALVLNVTHTQDWIASMETVVNRPNSASYVVVYQGSPTFYVRGDGLVCSATGFYDWSDESYKTNIVSIDNPLEKLMNLNGYYYDFSPEIQSLQHLDRQIGLIAQEVEAVIPEVVAIGMDDKRAVDYSKLVALLIEAVKVQQMQIEELEQMIITNEQNLQKCCPEYIFENKSLYDSPDGDSGLKGNDDNYLLQNNPNPFNTHTVIEYQIADKQATGVIYIFDLHGKLINTFENLNTGHSQITISASELEPGMYLYSLIVNGKEIDTRRMILTQ